MAESSKSKLGAESSSSAMSRLTPLPPVKFAMGGGVTVAATEITTGPPDGKTLAAKAVPASKLETSTPKESKTAPARRVEDGRFMLMELLRAYPDKGFRARIGS